MFDKLLDGIPLHEAASFFVGLKDFEKTADENDVHSSEYGPPDETGRFEGQFTVPVEQALALMQDMLANELKTMYAYKVYANSLRDLTHHAIAEEFEDHADQELEHADFLMRRMGVLGGPIHGPDIPAPPPSTDPVDIVRRMIRIEQEGIERWNRLHAITASNPMKFKIEEFLTREQEHLDELWQLMPHQANPAVLSQQVGLPLKAEPPRGDVGWKTAGAVGGTLGGLAGLAGSNQLFMRLVGSNQGLKAVPPLVAGAALGAVVGSKLEDSIRGKSKTAATLGLTREKDAEMPGGLPPAAMGQHQAPSQPTPLSGPAAGQVMSAKMASAMRKMSAEWSSVSPYFWGHSFLNPLPGSGYGAAAGGLMTEGDEQDPSLRGAAIGGLVGGAVYGLKGLRASPEYALPAAMLGALGGATGGAHAAHGIARDAKKKKKEAAVKEDADQVATGRSRALANAASGYEHDKHTRAEDAGENAGRLLGAYGGGKEGLKFTRGHGKHLELAGVLGGAVLGQHLGGKVLKRLGRKVDAHNFEKKHPKTASAMFKRALDELGAAMPALGGVEDVAPAPELDPETLAYLHREQAGMAAEKQNEQNFYKQKFDQASQELQMAQQQAQSAQQQMQQLQQQVDQSGQQQQAAMQQAQQVQQAAMQNAQAAHQAATQAMQQSLQAQGESMQQAQLAVGMRDAVHAMRQGIMQMVQQQLPPATPAEASGMQVDQMSASMGGQDNSQQPAQDPSQAGQPAAAPDAGTSPSSATPADASGAGTSPTPGAGAEPTMQGAAPQGQQGMAQEPPKTASASRDKLIGAIMGGLVGAGGTYAESRMSNDSLRDKVRGLEARDKSEGLGFARALDLAQAKSRLAIGEFTSKHPAAYTAMGTVAGAATGASLAPVVRHMSGG